MQELITAQHLAKYIDHTLLRPDATPQDIEKLCSEALKHSFFGVCVNSSYIKQVSQLLNGSSVLPVAVIGFPLGACSTEAKAYEASWCVDNGAKEIDMVLHVGLLKSGNHKQVEEDIRAVVQACKGVPLKVILETALLNQEEKIAACKLSVSAGAQFVKTCTGFGGGAATVEDISLMRTVVGPNLGVKASGGVKSLEQAQNLIAAGANRIGTSSGVMLVTGQKPQGGY